MYKQHSFKYSWGICMPDTVGFIVENQTTVLALMDLQSSKADRH